MLAHTNTTYNSLSYFDVAADCPGQLVVKIWDIQGRMAKTIKETIGEGAHKLSINVEDLKQGKYVMNIFNDLGFVKSIRYTKP